MFFKTPPEDFKYEVVTVTCIIEHDGKILLVKRVPGKVQENKWGVPGGKAAEKEDLKDALVREIVEETGIVLNPENLRPIGTAYVRYPEFDFTNHQFYVKVAARPEVELKLDEHSEYVWTTPPEAMKMDLILDQDQCFREYYGEM